MTRAGSLRGQGRQDWDVFFFFFFGLYYDDLTKPAEKPRLPFTGLF